MVIATFERKGFYKLTANLDIQDNGNKVIIGEFDIELNNADYAKDAVAFMMSTLSQRYKKVICDARLRNPDCFVVDQRKK